MKSKVIHHGSRHRPSRGRRKYREQRASADESLTLLQRIDQDLEWDDWHYFDSDDGTGFYDEHSFGLHCDGSADLIGGLVLASAEPVQQHSSGSIQDCSESADTIWTSYTQKLSAILAYNLLAMHRAQVTCR
jgi:hypothetical protein